MPAKRPNAELKDNDRGKGKYIPRVIVKFKDHIQIPTEEIGTKLDSLGIGPWEQLSKRYSGLNIVSLFGATKSVDLHALVSRAMERDPTYRPRNLHAYCALHCPAGAEPESMAKELSAWPNVEVAYVEPPPVEPPLVNPGDDPREPNQGYLNAAPDGIDAEYAWGFPGGDGAGQSVVDMEWGWTFNHEDLAAHGITLISGLNNSYFFHGTGVLGEIAAVDNTRGCVGITPNLASVRCVGQWLTGGGYSTSQPILDAIAVMNFGDVLILEAQTSLWGYVMVPVEIEPAVFDAIRLATALGIIVVQAAGNGGVDLDTVVNPGGDRVFNRTAPGFQDSGAIIVGAGSSAAPHTRLGFSCFGSRVDCYGWGENVDTLSTDGAGTATTLYTGGFNGTSSATPIVTGAALAVQGLAEANLGRRFAPWQMRAILSDPANGTPSQTPATDLIGVMPNLRAIIDGSVLNLAPDVYIRDYVGDSGDPHTGAISASPDVIARPTAVANPQATYGEGSGTENSATLGYEIEAGQDNFIYVRVRNRGGSAATNVSATVYWSPPSTLVTPDLWTLVGSTTLPNVPNGDILTVSNAIVWSSAAIPATGHYCFVALVGHPSDPAPSPADFINWDNFQRFIRENNNVTWRNFNVVNNVPPPNASPPGFVPIPFMAAGAPDKARPMQLEVIGKLPKGAKVILEMPRALADQAREPLIEVRGAKLRRLAHVQVNPAGRTRFKPVVFPAKGRIPMRLLVQIPKEHLRMFYEIAVRQMHEGQEVGRITWRIGPRADQQPK